jgi:hypothetical protein
VGWRTDGWRRNRYTGGSNHPEGLPMSNAIAAHKHRTRLHILRDRVQHALRDAKHGKAGAAERVVTHTAARTAYRTAHPPAKPRP